MNTFDKFRQMSVRKKLEVVLVAILAVIAVVQFKSVGKLQQWESQLGKFSMDYPRNWTTFELPQGNHGDKEAIAVLLAPYRIFPHVLIAQRRFPEKELIRVASWGEGRNHQRGKKYTSLKLEPISTSNITGQIREYTIVINVLLGTRTIHCLDLYTLNHNLGYQFAFCAYQSDWTRMSSVFQEMIQSIVFSQ